MTINRENTLADWKPGHVRAAVTEFDDEFPMLTWGTYGGHEPTKDRAVDGMVPNYKTQAGKELGWRVARWIWANRKRLGVWYVIFDAKIISETRPEAGWRDYVPTAAAVKKSRDSAYHYNHVHTSFYSAGPVVVPPIKFLPPYVVVTGCWAAHQTEPSKWRDAGKPITTLVEIEGDWGRTDKGYLYPMKYLTPKETP